MSKFGRRRGIVNINEAKVNAGFNNWAIFDYNNVDISHFVRMELQLGSIARHARSRSAERQQFFAGVDREDFAINSKLIAGEEIESFRTIEQFARCAQIADKIAALSCEIQLELKVGHASVFSQVNFCLIPAAAQIDYVITNLGRWLIGMLIVIVVIRQIVIQVGSQHNPLTVSRCEHFNHCVIALLIGLCSNRCSILGCQLGC